MVRFSLMSVFLTGSKESCGEGACGACTVMVSRYNRRLKRVMYPLIPYTSVLYMQGYEMQGSHWPVLEGRTATLRLVQYGVSYSQTTDASVVIILPSLQMLQASWVYEIQMWNRPQTGRCVHTVLLVLIIQSWWIVDCRFFGVQTCNWTVRARTVSGETNLPSLPFLRKPMKRRIEGHERSLENYRRPHNYL